jgi:hypothetical protein
MIRRGFWLAVGAATGIYGYRRVSAAGRRLSASLNPAPPAPTQAVQPARAAQIEQGLRTAQTAGRTAITAARETYRFTRDVREGMDLYMARQSEPPGPTLSTETDRQSTTREPEDGH